MSKLVDLRYECEPTLLRFAQAKTDLALCGLATRAVTVAISESVHLVHLAAIPNSLSSIDST